MSLRTKLRILRDLATTAPCLLAVSVFGAVTAVALLAIVVTQVILSLSIKPETYAAALAGIVAAALTMSRGRRQE